MNQGKKTRVAGFDRLRQMPEVFDLRTVEETCGVARDVAYLYCHRWASKGYVEQAGQRSGVYFNLIKDPRASSRIVEALRLGLRPTSLIAVGSTALEEHGLTTQRSTILQVAVPVHRKTRTIPQFNNVDLIPRNPEWFVTVEGHHMAGRHGLPVLDPAYALVDALTTKVRPCFSDDIWRPEPDDVEIPNDMDRDEFFEAVLEAADTLDADEDYIRDFFARIGNKHADKYTPRM